MEVLSLGPAKQAPQRPILENLFLAGDAPSVTAYSARSVQR